MKTFGLIGFPLNHSFSQSYFNNKFTTENIDAEYVNFEIEDIGEIMEVVAENPNLVGFNVTRPYKEQILSYLDKRTSEVIDIGAANVVKVINDKVNGISFAGYNTDYYGFRDSLLNIINPTKTIKALILGTGGASKAIKAALDSLDIENIKVSRNPSDKELSYDDLKDCIKDYFLIVNTTPLGTSPNTDKCPPLPYDLLTDSHLCYDLVYNPAITEFLKRSARQGAAVKNGLEMLRLQAELSWDIWNS